MARWMNGMDRINRTMQAVAAVMAKEAALHNPGVHYILNSYAFHCRQLRNTLQTLLPPGFEKSKIEQIFVDPNAGEQHELLNQDNTEKIRKRVLISSTFGTASKANRIIRVFSDLRNCKSITP